MAYSKQLLDHYENPRNVGSMDKEDTDVGTGLVGAPACGDVMKLQIKVSDQGTIDDAKFKTFGCGSAIASSSLVTEWVKGKTLKAYIHSREYQIGSARCLYEALQIFMKICDAISFAHNRGVLHLDLKPSNVMLASHGQVYVMDWGVATPIQSQDPYEEEVLQEASLDIADLGIHTFHGQIIGTPRYMAPEQALADSLRTQYENFKETYQKAAETKAKPDFSGGILLLIAAIAT